MKHYVLAFCRPQYERWMHITGNTPVTSTWVQHHSQLLAADGISIVELPDWNLSSHLGHAIPRPTIVSIEQQVMGMEHLGRLAMRTVVYSMDRLEQLHRTSTTNINSL
jgi:hypothetical protein